MNNNMHNNVYKKINEYEFINSEKGIKDIIYLYDQKYCMALFNNTVIGRIVPCPIEQKTPYFNTIQELLKYCEINEITTVNLAKVIVYR